MLSSKSLRAACQNPSGLSCVALPIFVLVISPLPIVYIFDVIFDVGWCITRVHYLTRAPLSTRKIFPFFAFFLPLFSPRENNNPFESLRLITSHYYNVIRFVSFLENKLFLLRWDGVGNEHHHRGNALGSWFFPFLNFYPRLFSRIENPWFLLKKIYIYIYISREIVDIYVFSRWNFFANKEGKIRRRKVRKRYCVTLHGLVKNIPEA